MVSSPHVYHVLPPDEWSPRANNIAATIITLIYVKLGVSTCNYLVKHNILSRDISRKVTHICAGCWLLFWPLFDTQDQTWVLNVFVPGVYSIVLLIKGLLLRDRKDPDVVAMSRSGDPSELLKGPLAFSLVMTAVGLFFFRQQEGYLMMAPLTFGDGLAPIVGSKVRLFKTKFRLLGRSKTCSGTFAMFLGSFLGCTLFWCLGFLPQPDWFLWCAVSAICTLVEAFAPADLDNLLIPVCALVTQRVFPH